MGRRSRLRTKVFVAHAVQWATLNAVLIVIWAFTGGGFPWFLFPLVGWGIFVAMHAVKAFVPPGRHHRFVVSAVYHGAVNLFLIMTWAITGAGFPWFVFPLVGSIAIVASRAVGLVIDHEDHDDDDQGHDPDRRRDRADLRAYRRKVQRDLGRELKRNIEQNIGRNIERGLDRGRMLLSVDKVASDVQAERPDLHLHAAPDGTITVLFSDIEGFTALNERLGDRLAYQLLRHHQSVVRQQVAAQGGFEVKSNGDGFMVAFPSARRALLCAIGIQRAFADDNRSSDEPIRVRIGLHTGEAIREADDFFGRTVIMAARVTAQANGGEILASSLVRELTASSGDFEFEDGRDVELKGLSGTHRVYPVTWTDAPARTR